MKEIEDFKTEIRNLQKLKIKTIENDFEKLISDLNFEKELTMEGTKKNRSKTRETENTKKTFIIKTI